MQQYKIFVKAQIYLPPKVLNNFLILNFQNTGIWE